MSYINVHKSIGKSRAEQEKNLRREGWGSTMTNEQLDKCKYLEKNLGNRHFFTQAEINRLVK